MKRTALALMLIALAASCNTEPKTAVQKKVDSYALVKIESPDLSGITDNGKEVLNLYKFAGQTRLTVSTGNSILVTRP